MRLLGAALFLYLARGVVGRMCPFSVEASLDAGEGFLEVSAFRLVIRVGGVLGEVDKKQSPGGGVFPDVGTKRYVLIPCDDPAAGDLDRVLVGSRSRRDREFIGLVPKHGTSPE